jgi:hypothetical protein
MKRTNFPPGWNEDRAQKVLEHYEQQTEDQAVAEDEAASRLRGQTVMVVPKRLVPEITRLIERRRAGRQPGSGRSNQASQPTPHKKRRA